MMIPPSAKSFALKFSGSMLFKNSMPSGVPLLGVSKIGLIVIPFAPCLSASWISCSECALKNTRGSFLRAALICRICVPLQCTPSKPNLRAKSRLELRRLGIP